MMAGAGILDSKARGMSHMIYNVYAVNQQLIFSAVSLPTPARMNGAGNKSGGENDYPHNHIC